MGCAMSMYNRSDEYKEMEFDKIKSNLKTGDIVLFSSNSFTSNITRIATMSPWSHVGMIIETDYFSKGTKQLYVWHSINEDIKPKNYMYKQKENGRGVQLNKFDSIIDYAGGDVYVRTSNYNVRDDLFKKHYNDFFKPFSKLGYEENVLEMLNAATQVVENIDTEETQSSQFCSELMAYTYNQMGWGSDKNIACNNYTPAHFSSGEENTYYKFKKGIIYGIETKVI